MGNAKDSTGTELTTGEQKRLDALEAIIAMWINDAAKVGDALGEIREATLYKATHKTFEAYCQDVWGMGRNYANKLIAARSVKALLEPLGTTVPTERVARELAPLASDPSKMIEAYQRALDEHDGKPTAAQVRKIVQPAALVLPPAEPAPEEVPASEVEIADPPVAEAKAKRVPTAPVPHEPTRSPATLASFTRAMRAALKDGWSLQEIADAGDKVIRGEE